MLLKRLLIMGLPLASLGTVLSLGTAQAQAITTASMSGTIADQSGAGLPGATVVATHTPTNTQYGTSTNATGEYNLRNLRVGGPYTVRITYVGYQDVVREGLTLSLGQNTRLDEKLSENSQQLANVVVESQQNSLFNANRTGAETKVSREQIERLPTLNRTFQDFTRLTPQANGNQLVGRSNRYNNISIDGAVNNDLFGLAASGTPGGQAGTQPISLDAIQEFQVVLAPFDVRQGGFTGGGINAVTRSGTNQVQGSLFAFGRNQRVVGKSPDDARTNAADFRDYQTGFRLGGPIVKDKLFFFVNGEITRRSEPNFTQIRPTGDASANSTYSNVTVAQAELVRQALITRYGYDPGAYGTFNTRTESNKAFARLDWNIDANNQLTLRHNFVDAFNDNLSRSVTSFRFSNNNYVFNSRTNSTVLEFNSRLGSKMTNNLIVGYSRIREKRDPQGNPFPQVTVQTDASTTLIFGRETFSNANALDQDVVELTDNFTYTVGKHLLTAGTHNEFFRFKNTFLRDLYGAYTFNGTAAVAASGGNPPRPALTGLENFLNADPNFRQPNPLAPTQNLPTSRPTFYSASYPTNSDAETPNAAFKVSQFGVYVQDEWMATKNLRLTGGLRLDIPVLPTTPFTNQKFNDSFKALGFDVATNQVPSSQVLFSPRLGFNLSLTDAEMTVVRGGTGLFTGRVPYVWVSNQYGNTGTDISRVSTSGTGNPTQFYANPLAQPNATTLNQPLASSEIDVTAKDFRFPQVWRSNLAVDQKLPLGLVGTLEAIYSRTVNDILYQDINQKPATGTTPDGRPFYNSNAAMRKLDPTYTNVILLGNTSRGYSYTLTAQLQKPFANGLTATAAYTYGQAKDVNSGTSSQAYSNWRFNQVKDNANDPPLSYSNYDLRHRVIGSLSYRREYLGHLATTFSVFYAGQSGTPYTYLYTNDINGDGESGNDLLYLPADLNSMVFNKTNTADQRTPDQIKQQFIDFVNNDSYLKDKKGQFTERNGARTPFTHQIDVRLMQDIFTNIGKNRNTLQISFDVFNIGNLLNQDWGRQYFVLNQANSLLTATRDMSASNPNGYTYQFNNQTVGYQVSNLASRWQGQLGLRYIFN